MAHESFEDPDTAALMSERFVNVKVDREERPDTDHIYMPALHALGEHGGWPLTMFLTPDGEPFWGGTYFPPEPRWGRPSFRQVLQGIAVAWSRGDAAVLRNAEALRQALSPNPAVCVLRADGGSAALGPAHPAFGKTALGDQPIACMCRGAARGPPVTDPEASRSAPPWIVLRGSGWVRTEALHPGGPFGLQWTGSVPRLSLPSDRAGVTVTSPGGNAY